MFTQNFFEAWTGMIKAIIATHDIYRSIKWVWSLVLFLLNILKTDIKRILLLFLVYLSRGKIDAHGIVGYNKRICLYVTSIALFKWLVLLWTEGKSKVDALSSLLSYLACKWAVKDIGRLKGGIQRALILI